jgi:hypothetical protein
MKIQIVLHCLPREIDEVYRIVDQLQRSSYFLEPGQEVILDFTLNVSDYMVDWKKSKLPKEFFIEKFKYIEQISNFENDFKITEELSGCNSVRRNAIRSDNGATHYLWLDTDLFFSQLNLQSMFQAISAIKDEYYIVSSELLQGWDTSWDTISNPVTRNTKRICNEEGQAIPEKCLWGTTNPYDILLENNTEKEISIRKIEDIKFGGGWFNLFNDKLLKLIDIPDSLGAYGLDDTFVMYGSMLMKQLGYNLNQYVLENMTVLENRWYRNYPYDKFLVHNSNKDILRKNAEKNWPAELEKLQNKLQYRLQKVL